MVAWGQGCPDDIRRPDGLLWAWAARALEDLFRAAGPAMLRMSRRLVSRPSDAWASVDLVRMSDSRWLCRSFMMDAPVFSISSTTAFAFLWRGSRRVVVRRGLARARRGPAPQAISARGNAVVARQHALALSAI